MPVQELGDQRGEGVYFSGEYGINDSCMFP